MKVPGCPLCEGPGGRLVFSGPAFRVIRAAEAGFPAFYRLVWSRHVAEFSDLDPQDRQACMDAVAGIESVLRTHLRPDKVNLAALGNAVPHLHWHIVARFAWDSHFPGSTWAGALREAPAAQLAQVEASLPAIDAAIAARLAPSPANRTAP